MTSAAWAWLGVAVVAALCDWWAVLRQVKRVEYVCKPLVMVALTAVAVSIDPAIPGRRAWVVVALLLSLAGDVFLMLPKDRFVAGLTAFLVAHGAYVIAFHIHGGSPAATAVAAGGVLVADVVAVPPILRALQQRHRDLILPVLVYVVMLSAMGTSALATRNLLACAGAVLFMTSDGVLAWNRFVQAFRAAPLVVIVTYHTAQTAFVLSLLANK